MLGARLQRDGRREAAADGVDDEGARADEEALLLLRVVDRPALDHALVDVPVAPHDGKRAVVAHVVRVAAVHAEAVGDRAQIALVVFLGVVRAHEVGVGAHVARGLQRRRAHAHADGGQRLVAVEGLGIRAPHPLLRVHVDREALGPHLGHCVTHDPALGIGLLNTEKVFHHSDKPCAVALDQLDLQRVDRRVGLAHLVARQLEQGGGPEVVGVLDDHRRVRAAGDRQEGE